MGEVVATYTFLYQEVPWPHQLDTTLLIPATAPAPATQQQKLQKHQHESLMQMLEQHLEGWFGEIETNISFHETKTETYSHQWRLGGGETARRPSLGRT